MTWVTVIGAMAMRQFGGPAPGPAKSTVWLAMLAWCAAAAMLFAGIEQWQHCRHLVLTHRPDLPLGDVLMLIWVRGGPKLLLLVPMLAVAGAALLAGCRRFAWWALCIPGTGLVWWFFLDLQVHTVTGNHLGQYLSLVNAAGIEAAGGMGWMVRYGLTLLGVSFLAVTASLWLCRLAMSFGRGHWPGTLGPPTVWVTALAYAALMVGWLPAALASAKPQVVDALRGTLPVKFACFGALGDPNYAFDRQLESQVGPDFGAWWGHRCTPADQRARIAGAHLPNVIVLVCESLRVDALQPAFMPRVAAWARGGLRFTDHYAGSNCTHLGMFELVYGRSCMNYGPTLDANVPAQACVTFHRSGYACTYLAAADLQWQGMERFINRGAFDILETQAHNPAGDGDRRAIERAWQIVQSAAGRAQFIVVFLQSTHYPYVYPARYEKFTPVMPLDTALPALRPGDAPAMKNRYHNAVGYVDDLIGEFVATLDPRHNIVVVTGDHGEALFDDGTAVHASRLSDVQMRVPLVIAGPGIPIGTDARPTIHGDILPTLLHAAGGAEVPIAGAQGIDLLTPAESHPRQALVICEVPAPSDPCDLLLLRGEERLNVWLSISDRQHIRARAYDASGGMAPTALEPDQAAGWVTALRDQLKSGMVVRAGNHPAGS
jgi:hypothetical protein